MKILLLLLPITGVFIAIISLYLLGIRFFVITSGSMEPQLKKGDIIVTYRQADYAIGNVISYKNNEQVVTHKVMAKHIRDGKISYQTKGNANEVADSGLVENKNIVGKVFHAVPKIGMIFLLPKTAYIIILMWIMSGTVIFLELQQVSQYISKYLV